MIVPLEGSEARLPDFLIVGAAKSGTTALVHYIEQHPQIMIPIKEPGFFCSTKFETQENKAHLKNKIMSLEEYINLYNKIESEKILGDATTRYLYLYEKTIAKIRNVYKQKSADVKIIIILRNPIDRAFSHYVFNILRGMETLTFKEAIKPDIINAREIYHHSFNYINFGMYYEQVKTYKHFFPKTLVFLFEDLKNPSMLARDSFKFLDVDHNFQINQNIFINPSGIPKNRTLVHFFRASNPVSRFIKKITPPGMRPNLLKIRYNMLRMLLTKPKMPINTRRYLLQIYKNEILQLQELIGRNLNSWLNGE